MYETKRNLFDTLVQTIQNADGTEIDLNAAHRTVDYFTGENAIPYQKEALRYRIVSQITDRLGDQLIQKYDIQPDPFIYRIGDTIKVLATFPDASISARPREQFRSARRRAGTGPTPTIGDSVSTRTKEERS